jgi:hypothetical protein
MMIIIYKVNWFDYDHHQCILSLCFEGVSHESVKRAGSRKQDANR